MGSTCSTTASCDSGCDEGDQPHEVPLALPSADATLETAPLVMRPSPLSSAPMPAPSPRNPLRPLASSFVTIADLDLPSTAQSHFPSARSTPRSRTCTIDVPSSNSSRAKRNDILVSPLLRSDSAKQVTTHALNQCEEVFDSTLCFAIPMPWHSS
ncbi:Hypothetical protein, putative [Bodo saltans]|uniref:Uncharacterized protein n=1 Tax=Bodo saltans TaxID=75058 RepID=A0A0S4IZS3_BODSA|nr:Hypothetical protein, putative [Bodo saltans]|eukprot:CUF94112.1 Hypothetical protein, putative [Bodo saltans]